MDSRLVLNLSRLVSSLQSATERATKEKELLDLAEAYVQAVENAQRLAQVVAEQVQTAAHTQVVSIVTRCLQAVMGKEYGFKIEFVRKRGKTEAVFKYTKNGMELDTDDSSGGGLTDLASFGLRLAALVLTRPVKRRFLCLDEPFKHLSRNYSDRAREMLETLSSELGFQVVVVTHNPRLISGKEVRL